MIMSIDIYSFINSRAVYMLTIETVANFASEFCESEKAKVEI